MTATRIIIAGQSNALGYLNTGPAPYVPDARVQIWCDTNADGVPDAWNFMNPGANTGTLANPNVWGPEVEFANQWKSKNVGSNDSLWIVKEGCVKGSTYLQEETANGVLDWSPESTNELFATAHATVLAAMANVAGNPAEAFTAYDALLWMQGEQDATDQTAADNYNVNLRDFLSHVRDPTVGWAVNKVLIARIAAPLTAYHDTVRLAQWAVSFDDLANSPGFATKDLPLRNDSLHYTDQGHILLGRRFWNVMQGE
jgi:hypothetical protein